MKRILSTLTLLLCFAFTAVNAQVITVERAAEIANSFFSAGVQKSAAARGVVSSPSLTSSFDSNDVAETASAEPTFYVLTNPEGGFVIVSGEETENPIIGYSLDGTIDVNNLPDGFVDYMTDIDAQVKALREYNANNPQKAAASRSAMQKTNYNATSMGETVVLMETAKWAQTSPFNNQCWTDFSHETHALTGCVPTAFAIIMRYHEWPVVGTGAIQDCQDAELPYTYYDNRTYDYSKMPLVYDGNWTEEQKNEVAKLMSHLGHAFGASYGTGSTGVSMSNSQTTATKKYFNYQDCSISNQYNNGSMTDFTSWKNSLKNSLDNNCPVPYGANNIGSGTVDARHMFVVDGYTDNDYFHINFGWGGGSNGWYKLDAITVGYSWSDDADGYTSKHQAFFNLTPDKTKYPVTATVEPENAGTVTVNPAEQVEGGNVTLTATANTGYTFQNWTKGGEVVSTNKSCTVKVASSDNEYVANFLTVGNTTVNVTVTYNSSYGTVTGTSGTVANGTTLTPRLNEEVTLTATPVNDYIFTGWTVTKGTNSTNYAGSELTLVATENMSVTANFTLAIVDYNMIIDNVSPSGSLTGARNSTWTYNTDNNHPAALKLQSSNGSKEVNGLSNSYNRLYAYVYDAKDTGYSSATYTLSVPDGYIITSYNLTYWVYNSFIGQVTVSNGTTTETPNDTNNHSLTATPNAQTAQFTISTSQSGQQYITIESFIVTVMKDGAGSGSTPPSTQYTITATANPADGGTVTGGGTYNEGAEVTLTATANPGYTFSYWSNNKNGTEMIKSATHTFTASQDVTYTANFEIEESQDVLTTGYYHLVSRVTTAHEYLYNNALRTNNSKKYTLQSDSKITTNNGIWYITVNGDQLGVKNGDGNALVTGTAYCAAATSHNTLNIQKTTIVDDVTYYSFVEGINCTNRTQFNFTLEGGTYVKDTDNNYVTTWADHPDDQANQWRLESVDTDGKNIYDVVVECTEQDVYVVYGSGTNEEYAFNGGFFITDATITAQQLTAKKGNETAQDVTISVEGNTIRVVDTESFDITVSITPAEGGSVTGGGTYNEGATVTLTATPAEGYHFVNWTDGINEVSTDANYEFNITAAIELTANFAKNSYTVNVSTNGTGGSASASAATVEHGNKVTLTATPAEGYHFVNWTNNLNTDFVTENPYTPTVAANVTYTANFAKNSYELTYIVEGVETTHNVEYGASLPAAPATEKTGYTFTSWDKEPPATMPAEDVTLTAQFTINSYKLTYIVDDVETTHNVVYGASLPAAPATEKTGYTFTSWDKEVPATMPAEDVTLTAQFQQNVVTPTYYNVSVNPADTNGSVNAEYIGTGKKVEAGTEVTFTATPNGGYEFDGWYNGETLVTKVNPYTFTVTSDINYTAKFKEEAGETPTTYAIRIETVDANGNPLVNNATGQVQALINNVGMEWCTAYEFNANANVELVATSDHNESGYLFDGWYKNDNVFVSNDLGITVQATEAATYQARFSLGRIVTLASSSNTWGYPNIITYENGDPVVGTAIKLRAVVRDGERLLISINPNYGYRVVNWTDKSGNEVAGKNANSFILTVNGDNNYTANLERVTYTLTVRANNEGGTVSATSEISTGTNIQVGHNMEATITATAKPGYRFVNWTKGTNVVSESATYTIPGIADVEDMLDADYEAVFEEVEAGTYYRIAYDFEVPAQSVATRAATDETQTYVVSPNTGTPNDAGTFNSSWTYTKNGAYQADLTMASTSNGNSVNKINTMNNGIQHSLAAYYKVNGVVYGVTYTVSVPENGNYKIAGYSIGYTAFQDVTVNSTATNNGKTGSIQATGLDVYSFDFTVSSTSSSGAIDITEFEVYIEYVGDAGEGGGETPEPEPEPTTVKYYVQSEACGVSGKENALKMTPQETGAASIFYYADNKLMSYATGTYVNENGGTRGLQDVGVAGGDVTFESNKIKFTNGLNVAYMHAVINQNGTSYVDHCSSDNGDPQHNFIIEEVDSLPVTISDAGYATWYAPVAVQLPYELTAYTITIQGNYAITGDGFKEVPANTGVILEGAEGTYKLEIINSAPEVKSIMEGTVAATYFPENDYAYVLSTDKGTRELGFYMANDGQASWSHKAYLPKSAIPADAQLSAGFRLILPGTTAVENVEMRNEKEEIYDLTGRKLEGISGTGIYIINGKKVIVR